MQSCADRQRVSRRVRRHALRRRRDRRPPGVGGTAAGQVSTGMLASLRVLDLGGAESDGVGRMFADLGADVLKIEPPGGGLSPGGRRPRVAGTSIAFTMQNANKRCAILDPGSATDRQRLIELAGSRRHRRRQRNSGGAAAIRDVVRGTGRAVRPPGRVVGHRLRHRRSLRVRGRPPTPCFYAMSTALSRTGPTTGTPGSCRPTASRRPRQQRRPRGRRWPPTIDRLRCGRGDYIDFSRSRPFCKRSTRPSGRRVKRRSA